jgi:hypothetical protein
MRGSWGRGNWGGNVRGRRKECGLDENGRMRRNEMGCVFLINPLDKGRDRWRHGSRKRLTAAIVQDSRVQDFNARRRVSRRSSLIHPPSQIGSIKAISPPNRVSVRLNSLVFHAIRIDYVYWHETCVSLLVRDRSSHPFLSEHKLRAARKVADPCFAPNSPLRSDSLVRHVVLSVSLHHLPHSAATLHS